MTQVIPKSKNCSPLCICAENYLYKCGVFEYNKAEMDFKKILFFKPGAIGDFLHTLPALTALKKKFPSAQVTVVVSPGQESLIQGTHLADSVLVFDKPFLKKRFRHFLDFGLSLRRQRYDLVVDMQPSLRSLVLRLLMGAKRTLVYRKQKKVRRGERRLHAAENFMETLRPIGIHDRVEEIALPIKPEAAQSVDHFLAQQGVVRDSLLIALNCSAGAARPARNWYPERFAALGNRLIEELDAAVIFVGGKEDRDLVARAMSLMKHRAVSAAGLLSIPETAALFTRCKCLVSSDTGPLHLATAVHTPVVGLYGSTDPRRTGPIGRRQHVLIKELSCVPCEEKNCPLGTRACMAAITVDEVFQAVRSMVACE